MVKALLRSFRGYRAGLLSLAFGLLVGAGCINADGWVAEGTVSRIASGHPLDYDYLASLGPDARPILDEQVVERDWGGLERLVESWDEKEAALSEGDWRSRRGIAALLRERSHTAPTALAP